MFTITNDKYSQQPDVVTLEELKQMCRDNGWDDTLRVRGAKVLDANGEVVAEEYEVDDYDPNESEGCSGYDSNGYDPRS